jgi:hypothetical protein
MHDCLGHAPSVSAARTPIVVDRRDVPDFPVALGFPIVLDWSRGSLSRAEVYAALLEHRSAVEARYARLTSPITDAENRAADTSLPGDGAP